MTQEDKDLLIKDICTRLPYHVKVKITYSKENGSSLRQKICKEGDNELNSSIYWLYEKNEINIKPYLFPLSSMEELGLLEEYENIVCCLNNDKNTDFVFLNHINQLLEFYHRNHLDYNGLIPKDLAINATELNIY